MSGGIPMPPGSEDKLAQYWPAEDETSYARESGAQMVLAQQTKHARGVAQQVQNYAGSEMEGLAPAELERLLGIRGAEMATNAAVHENTAGWLAQGQTDIITCKNALIAAYSNYKTAMVAAATQSSVLGVMQVHDKIESEFRSACDLAKSGYEKSRDLLTEAVETGKTPPMKGLPPSAGKPNLNDTTSDIGVEQRTPDAVNPNLFDPSTGGYSTPTQGAGANTPGGGAGSGPAVGPVAGGGRPVAGGGLSNDGFWVGEPHAGSPPGSPAGAPINGGMPMGGMPMQGMQGMPPPQMPQMPSGGQTPGSDLAKTGSDMITKLAGADKGAGAGGVPVTPDQLDKLLAKQGGDDGGGLGGEKGEGGSTADGPGEKGDKKLSGTTTSTSGTTMNGPGGPNAGAAGTHTGPGTPAGPPSPAAPVTTHAPASPSAAPMTELSADETPTGRQPPQRSLDQTHHNAVAGTGQSTSSMAPFLGPPPAAVGQTSSAVAGPMVMPPMGPMAPPPAPSLGTYSPGALGSGSAPAAPVPSTPAPAMPTGAVVAGAAAAPIFTPMRARTVEVKNFVAAQHDSPAEFVARIEGLNPDHALAHLYLAQLLASAAGAGWLTTAAVAVLTPADPATAPLYVLATADGLSVVPAGASIPGRLRLLTEFEPPATFVARWAGYEHPAATLTAFAATPNCPAGHQLAYLVSSDTSDSKAGRYHTGCVPEVVQDGAEQSWLLDQHREPVRPRAALGSNIAAHQAEAALSAFGEVWRITDATDARRAMATLWADRWESEDHAGRHYIRSVARYWHADAHQCVGAGNLAEAAYAVSQLARLEP